MKGKNVNPDTFLEKDSMADSINLNVQTLSRHLFEAANIIRSTVDRADFKTYIFPLLFFKRISDVYEETFEDALAESGGDTQYAQLIEKRFHIPEGALWKDVRAVTKDVGQALHQAMREIEKANPDTLYGVFGTARFTNKTQFTDALLRDLIEHFSKVPLGNKYAKSDIMGDAYEYLIKKFADISKKKAGEFYTPRSVINLMIQILDPKEGETICDPACGTGGMLLGTINYVKGSKGDVRTLWGKLYGQEKNPTTSSIARMNLILHGAEEFSIITGDTLRQPGFYEGDIITKFDCVIANPPFSLKKWGAEIWSNDPFGRNFAGLPPERYADFAWVQHMIHSMTPVTGRMAVVIPQGVLFRRSEGKIRRKILEMDILEAVIGLATNLFYGSTLAPVILIFRQSKLPERKNKILFIDASKQFWCGRAQNELRQEHVDQIFTWYEKWMDVDGFCNVATLDEVVEEGWNLNIGRYVSPVEEDEIPLRVAIEELRGSLSEAHKSEEELKILLRELSLI